MILRALNPLMTGGDKETTHTQTNLQLKAASLFKYVSPYCNHQALKGYNVPVVTFSITVGFSISSSDEFLDNV